MFRPQQDPADFFFYRNLNGATGKGLFFAPQTGTTNGFVPVLVLATRRMSRPSATLSTEIGADLLGLRGD